MGKTWKPPNSPSKNEWLKKIRSTMYLQENIINHQEENPGTCDNRDGCEGIMLSEIRQREKRKMLYDLTHLWKLKKPSTQK